MLLMNGEQDFLLRTNLCTFVRVHLSAKIPRERQKWKYFIFENKFLNFLQKRFVEDVKSLFRVIIVFLPVPFFWSLYDQQVGEMFLFVWCCTLFYVFIKIFRSEYNEWFILSKLFHSKLSALLTCLFFIFQHYLISLCLKTAR